GAEEGRVSGQGGRPENSRITHTRSQRTVSFGNIAAVAAKLDVPKDVKLKDPKDWKIAGKPAKRLDVSDKVQGKPVYGIDVRVPNMLYASLVQCPVFGGTFKSVDES